MSGYSYLVYLANPFNPERPPQLFLRKGPRGCRQIRFQQLVRSPNTVVSYHLNDLFACYRGPANARVSNLVDVSEVARLLHVRPHLGRKGDAPWKIWNLVRAESGNEEDTRLLYDYMYEGRTDVAQSALQAAIETFSVILERIWQDLRKRLLQQGEAARYYEIEKPVNEVLLRQQALGVRVDQRALLHRLEDIDREQRLAAKALRDTWGVKDPFDLADVRAALRREGLGSLGEAKESVFDSLLDLHAEHAALPSHLRSYRQARRGKSILLRLGGIASDRTYPMYTTLGTVTGRISVESPLLQHLKRSQRDVLAADAGKVLLYPDYSQFEPGIMADDSADAQLIADFNSGDVYNALSIQLFGDTGHRSSAKVLFLAFCYGMTLERMIRHAVETTHKSSQEIRRIISAFFGRYEALPFWADRLRSVLESEGRVGTRLGNYRYRENLEGELAPKERRWAMSQRIQGTASLILKRVILHVAKSLPEIDILLPMHDALLVQVPAACRGELKVKIRHIFVEEFRRECPRVCPRVTFESFAQK